ncbi:amidohydrolase [Staphylococcus sp. IVB6181]|uniref:M20 metallopeptidase family protein n=1 Tax=Staphylococcus sp. IVB6181 TaxID=2929481 RepID=UPI0021CDFA9D|nr:amidohydrolase [Staphylococcus sp. IVB6181]UXV35160.1 amidohydrolase [Staphylococcus sp. IVB6181]
MNYEQYKDRIIAYRRHLHAHPEVSFQEYETAAFIREQLYNMDCKVVELTETSTVAVFNEGKGKKIGLRADIDALPMQEQRTDLEFMSQNKGVMHACGHDGHTAVLLGAAHYFDEHRASIPNEVHCIFQHAEELIPGGAREMVATGYFDDFDFIYGHHLWTPLELGFIDIKEGPASANSDIYHITIKGHGGHASQPNLALDPLVLGAQFVNNLQTIVSRDVYPFDPVVVSNTIFQAGNIGAENVIADKITLGGSVRTTKEENRQLVKRQMERLLATTCESVGATYKLDYLVGYDGVYNDPEKTRFVKQLAETYFPGKVVTKDPMMGGEDFSAFSNIVPSTYVFIGAGTKAGEYDRPHHHPRFALNEDAFEMAFDMFVEVAKHYK